MFALFVVLIPNKVLTETLLPKKAARKSPTISASCATNTPIKKAGAPSFPQTKSNVHLNPASCFGTKP